MSAETCVIALGRYGDVINVLPCVRDIALREGKCAVMISAEFASVLDGCSYVEAIVVSDHFTDYLPSVEQAKQMFKRVLIAKVNEKSVGVTTKCDSFSQEQWRQLGYLDRFNDLPLVFDRRDRKRENQLIQQWSNGASPMVLVNFSGRSAPFKHGEQVTRWLPSYNIVDLGNVKAHRIYDLIGLFDVADLLITGDTSTLHLAAASGVPVVNLIGDTPTRWHGSKPRNNSVLEIRYSEVERLKEIPNSKLTWRPRTWHVWSDYAMSGDALRRHQLAKSTWPTAWITFPVRENRRVMNDPMRSLPFIKDLVNAAVDCAGPRDRIVLTNADTCVGEEAAGRMEEALRERGCAYSFRRDFQGLYGAKRTDEIRQARQYEGADLFAFTIDWWKKHGRLLPDVVLGAEAWDWCFRTLMHTTGGAQFNDLIYHEAHPTLWHDPNYRDSLPSQLHNKRLAAPFLAEHGVGMGK